ncbi:MAG: nicotinamide riboside transporter PnuC [Puia sp.]
MQQIAQQFLSDIQQTTWIEFIAVITGIASVIYSRKENILVYPVGMVSTGIFIYLYLKHGLYADASVNFYYTVMSILGWHMWSRKTGSRPAEDIRANQMNAKSDLRTGNSSHQPTFASLRRPRPSTINHQPKKKTALKITASTPKEWLNAFIFFSVCWVLLYLFLKHFTDSTVPVADSFTSGAAFTGMWLMNKKKLENWTWWIITDLASVPLNFYKHLVFTSFQYLVFLILAVMGYISWRKKTGHAVA